MLNRPWIDPRDIDYTDALNPLAKPGWKQNNNPFAWAAARDVFMQALRQGKGIEPRIYVCPDPATQLIGPNQTIDYEVPSEPNTWLWALNASYVQSGDDSPVDFLVNITDSLTGATLFSQPIATKNLNAQLSGTSDRGPLFLLETPHLFRPPSYPVVRIINSSDTITEFCRVTLFTCVEYNQQ